jgi:CheY-like chemotaxis protein
LPSLLLQPLIENAIKYAVTPQEEGADITLSARLAGQNVQITVSDTGAGLSADRTDAPQALQRGSGLGLANIRDRLAQAFGDRPPFRRPWGAEGGFTVVIEIPFQPDGQDDHWNRMTIRTILVDDESLAIQGLQLRLEPHTDVEIIDTAQNGREAIRAIKTHKPDLVFLDIQMPGFDGFSVVQGLMEVEPPLFVFVTAYSDHAIRAFEAQAVDYLMKPVEPERLADTLDRVRQRLPKSAASKKSSG